MPRFLVLVLAGCPWVSPRAHRENQADADRCLGVDRELDVPSLPFEYGGTACPGAEDRFTIDLGIEQLCFLLSDVDCDDTLEVVLLDEDGPVMDVGGCGPFSFGAAGDPAFITVTTQLGAETPYTLTFEEG